MGTYKPFGNGGTAIEGAASADFLKLDGAGSGDNVADSGGDSGRNDTDANGDRFDSAIHVGRDKFNKDGSFRKKRGRKASNSSGSGSGYGRGQKSNKANIESLTSILAIVHAGLASATKTPELALEIDDAEALANATANVLIEFDIQPNPKVQAVVGLVMTAGAVYGPKVYMIRERWKEERKETNNNE